MPTDPIELEIFKNIFVSVAEEMGVTLCRTGFSSNIKERLDYSCAIYDAQGHTIAQGDHLPVHLGAMPLSVRAAIESGPLYPGDTIILNDPFRGGTHLPDITLVSPVFVPEASQGAAPETIPSSVPSAISGIIPDPDPGATSRPTPQAASGAISNPLSGALPREFSAMPQAGVSSQASEHPSTAAPAKPAFYVANRAHHSDVGGMSPGSMPLAREIFQEGLILPPVKLIKRGEIDRDILALILANVRTPGEREGDLSAQIAANRVGEQRLLRLVERYGLSKTHRYATATQDYAERVLRRTISAIPDGRYQFADALDNDGFSSHPITIRCTLTIEDDHATVDFNGSDPQTSGGVNANYAITLSATLYCFRCLIEEDVLYNAGIERAVRVIAPPGSVVNAQHPSAVAGGNVECSQRITDVVLGALAQALPDRIPAASQGTMNNVTLGGRDTRGVRDSRSEPNSEPNSGPDSSPNSGPGQPFAYYETAGGGMGGRNGLPGLSGVHTHMSNTRNTPVEALEQALPIRIATYALRQGSGGAGRFPGGEGLVREYVALVPTEATILTDRRESRPYGAQGGAAGREGRNTLIRADGSVHPLPAKASFELAAGDRLRIETPGGGGYGKRN
jgi:N-methylhydantoinase B/oxoprolinase/acetone carboxylase alpha subunit